MEKSNFLLSAKSLKKMALFAMIAFFAPSVAFADNASVNAVQQNNIVKGTIVDTAGEPVVGATIKVIGANTGVATDVDGNFSLAVDNGAKLEISAIGYKTVQATAQNGMNVTLEEDALLLDEVVALGFGVQARKQDLSGSVGTLAMPEKVQMRSLTSSTGMLQGQVPGVTVTENSGAPGGDFSMTIRGKGSGSDGILWVVDGVPNAQIPAASEIESMTILKDAASAAVYGASAANGGVIIVTTKSAKKGLKGVALEYDGQLSVANAINTIHGLSAADQIEMRNRDDEGWFKAFSAGAQDYISQQRTDWTDAIFRSAIRQRHTVALNYSNEVMRNRVSFTYSNRQGTLKNTFDKFVNAHYKGDFDINKWINISEDANWRHSRGRGANTSGVTDGVLINAIYAPQCAPTYNEDGTFSSWLPMEYNSNTTQFGDIYNPLRLLEGDDNWNTWQEFQTNTALTIHNIIPGLKFTSRYTYVLAHNYYKNFHHYRYERTGRQESPSNAGLSEGASTSYRWQTENTLNYDNNFGLHNVSLMLSTTASKTTGRWSSISGSGYSDESTALQYIDFADSKVANDGYNGMDTNVAVVARAGYSYADRYFLTASVRKDWAGRLVYEHNSGTFPAFTAAWKLSSEKFWEPLKDKIQLFKIRGSWGRVGNMGSVGVNYSAVNLYRGGDYTKRERAQYGMEGAPLWGTTVYNGRAFNPLLTWETSEQWGIGLDLATFNNRLSLSFDYFNKRTFDLIQSQTLNFPNYIGVDTRPSINSGEVVNKGIEVTAAWNDKIGRDFHYYLRGNLAWLHNEVTKTSEQDNEGNWIDWVQGGSFRNLYDVYRTTAGGPFDQFYLIKTDGIFQTQAEIDAYTKDGNKIQPNAQPGDLKFIDANNDGQITDADRQFCGNATPKWTYALSGGFDYKKFAVDFMFQGVGGAQVFYCGKTMIFNDNEGNFNRAEGIKDSWGWGKTTDATIPRLSRSDANGNFSRTSDYYLESGSYLRLKSLSISYDFTDLIRKVSHFGDRGSTLSAYITGENLFTITPYSGMDPECGGWDSIKFPVSRTISFGVRITY
ncbi:MAG: TonB-dependent receptor [Prevotella sp.]|nr:TonB-dependent receptor [Prevotella sp.]